MSIKDIKQYLEKELHSKRFLQEGLDVITTLEKAEDEHRSITKQVNAGRKELEAIAAEKETDSASLKAVKQTLADKSKERDTILDKAREEADAIVTAGKVSAKTLVDNTTAELLAVRNSIATYKEQEKQKIADIAELEKVKDSLNKDIDKIRKKFAGE